MVASVNTLFCENPNLVLSTLVKWCVGGILFRLAQFYLCEGWKEFQPLVSWLDLVCMKKLSFMDAEIDERAEEEPVEKCKHAGKRGNFARFV